MSKKEKVVYVLMVTLITFIVANSFYLYGKTQGKRANEKIVEEPKRAEMETIKRRILEKIEYKNKVIETQDKLMEIYKLQLEECKKKHAPKINPEGMKTLLEKGNEFIETSKKMMEPPIE